MKKAEGPISATFSCPVFALPEEPKIQRTVTEDGGLLISGLARWNPDRQVRVRALARVVALCS